MIDWNYPKTVEEAVQRLISELPLKDRVHIAGLDKEDLLIIQMSLESHIRQDFGLQTGNRALIESCRAVSGIKDLRAHQCIPVIMETLWTRLRETHALRVVEHRQKG